jgi:cytochrome c nitrite reductase small subunit
MSFKSFLKGLIPPAQWRVPVIISLGILTGMGILIFHISNASSYISNDPQTCINCHVMTTQFASWQRSSHAHVATCNDCHVPHDNFIHTYAFKASDGIRHATMFTFRLEPQVIRIKDAGINVVQANCIRCHNMLVNSTWLINVNGKSAMHGQGQLCWNCHRETPHGRVSSLSAYPNAMVPKLSPIIPDWLRKMTTKK